MVHYRCQLCPDLLSARRRYSRNPDVSFSYLSCLLLSTYRRVSFSLSWADTAASTIGRLWTGHWGLYTPRLPSRLPIIPFLPAHLKHRLALPLAPRKSLVGFIAASLTGACIALGFWGWMAPVPLRVERGDVTWFWDGGVFGSGGFGGWVGLSIIALFAGLVSGIAEALGKPVLCVFFVQSC